MIKRVLAVLGAVIVLGIFLWVFVIPHWLGVIL